LNCSNCGTENPPGSKFCIECAARLSAECPSCGHANLPTAKFCAECATPLGRPGPAQSDRAGSDAGTRVTIEPVAERRLVSVLFADLVGFTALSADRDPEETRELLTRYFDLSREVIGRYGGTVEKFIGDAVMAVWGAPVAREDDAERAVRAALELVAAVPTLGSEIGARAGVLTGEAAVTLGATNQGMVAGDLVNTASRLQSVAPSGAVLVGETTHRAASKAIAFEEAGDHVLKGKASPVPAWRALRVVAEVGGRNRSDSLEAPFVGRDEEFRLLKDLFHATSREQRTRLVSVIGPAGIGKSRLAWEFLKYVDGLVDTVWWHDGRSPAYGEGITFWALGEMVRGRCGLLETDDEATTRAKVSETVARWVADEEERRWIGSALLALLGVEAQVGSDELFGAWRTFFERIAATGPLVMVFEDLHFADSGLLDFVDHVLEWSKGVPIYIVTLARPEMLERRPDWGAGKRSFFSLSLDPLSPRAMRELLAGLAPGLPEPAVRAIVGRADGIPLYAVETVRMLVAEGRLKEEGAVYRPVGDLTTLSVPETLTALIASRLDTLASDDRALVSDAAVLGQSFTIAALSAVSGTVAADLEPRLRTLVRRELLTLRADPRSPERGQYAFVQALIREVAYNRLARQDRKTRHLAAARFFESLGTDELAGALASHYIGAHANAGDGPEKAALAAQARIALRAAADRAAALGSHDQAINFLEQALSVATDPLDEAELLERAGESATTAARYDEAEEFFNRALALHRERGDRAAAARTIAALGRARITRRRLNEAIQLLEPAAAEFADLFPDTGAVALEGQLARAYFLHEEPRRSIEISDRVLEAAEHADLLHILADTLVTKGSALGSLGRLREAIGVIQIGEGIARGKGHTRTLLRALLNRTAFQYDMDPRAALEASAEALALARRIGSREFLFGFVNANAWGALSSGDADAALAGWESGLSDDLDTSDRIDLLSGLITVHALRGEPVVEETAELARLVAEVSDPQMTSNGTATRAWVAFVAGRLAAARDDWRTCASMVAGAAPTFYAQAARAALWDRDLDAAVIDLAALEATGVHAPVAEARRLTIRAGLTALDGRAADALRLYRDALRSWVELGQNFEEAFTGLDAALLLDPSEPEVAAAADRARAVFRQMEFVPILSKLDEATKSSTRMPRAAEVAPTA
jgi:class 3 adenylate cyclase/tetratricopeptide (TPR) repeat protein